MHLRAVFVSVAVLVLALASSSLGAGDYFEGWDAGSTAGWTGNTVGSLVDVQNTGGNPGGYLQTHCDPAYAGMDIGFRPILPVALGNYAAARIFRVSFDLMPIADSIRWACFRVRYQDSRWNGWWYQLRRPHPRGVWTADTVVFDPTWPDSCARAAGWFREDHAPSFRETMADVYSAEIRLYSPGGLLVAGIDNLHLEATVMVPVSVDILPRQCPNWLSLDAPRAIDLPRTASSVPQEHGLEVAILGAPTFGVDQINPSAVRILGLRPSAVRLEDVSRPLLARESGDCECDNAGDDGYLDWVVTFNLDSVLARLCPCTVGEVRTLELTAPLALGRELVGRDCVNLTDFIATSPGTAPRARSGLQVCSPNPFNAATTISYSIATDGPARLEIFNVIGQHVLTLADGIQSAGLHTVTWTGTDDRGRPVASGVYLYRLSVNGFSESKTMVLLK